MTESDRLCGDRLRIPFLAFVIQKNVGTGDDVTGDVTIGITGDYLKDYRVLSGSPD